ncbi:MAG: phosphoglucosamine mutase [Planctomycetes bacterium]|nr:phosphoglucosamine mutase [Planctomycetota bacterium]
MHQRRYFGTDGIRDLANSGHLVPDMVLRIGHAIGRVVFESARGEYKPKILMVRDTRVSGPMIQGILGGAILAHGVDVYDAGVLPTPAAALLVRRCDFDLGIVVSASHNPMPDNGIKIFGADGRKLSDDTELEIERYIDKAGSRDVEFTGRDIGRHVPYPEGAEIYMEAMVEELFKDLDLGGQKIVIDCSNGSGSKISPRILAALGAEVVAVNHEPDGFNINDQAGVFFIEQVGEVVRREGAHWGFALDGDGDRVLMVDENGEVQDGDRILAILARRLPVDNRQIVATVMSNMGLKVLMKELRVDLHQTAVGDRYVAEKMEQTATLVGGEQSGHIIFNQDGAWYGDGVFTALQVARVMRDEKAPLSRLAGAMERFPQVLKNVRVKEKPPMSDLPAVQEAQRRHQVALGDEGRILLRYSGTEMLARVMVEGRSRAEIEAIADHLVHLLRNEIGA